MSPEELMIKYKKEITKIYNSCESINKKTNKENASEFYKELYNKRELYTRELRDDLESICLNDIGTTCIHNIIKGKNKGFCPVMIPCSYCRIYLFIKEYYKPKIKVV